MHKISSSTSCNLMLIKFRHLNSIRINKLKRSLLHLKLDMLALPVLQSRNFSRISDSVERVWRQFRNNKTAQNYFIIKRTNIKKMNLIWKSQCFTKKEINLKFTKMACLGTLIKDSKHKLNWIYSNKDFSELNLMKNCWTFVIVIVDLWFCHLCQVC